MVVGQVPTGFASPLSQGELLFSSHELTWACAGSKCGMSKVGMIPPLPSPRRAVCCRLSRRIPPPKHPANNRPSGVPKVGCSATLFGVLPPGEPLAGRKPPRYTAASIYTRRYPYSVLLAHDSRCHSRSHRLFGTGVDQDPAAASRGRDHGRHQPQEGNPPLGIGPSLAGRPARFAAGRSYGPRPSPRGPTASLAACRMA